MTTTQRPDRLQPFIDFADPWLFANVLETALADARHDAALAAQHDEFGGELVNDFEASFARFVADEIRFIEQSNFYTEHSEAA